jgi:hypothetical protein
MANTNLGKNIWTLDTAATIKASTEPVYIKKMVFKPSAADDDCVVTDGDGVQIWAIRAAASGANNESYGLEQAVFEQWYNGFILNTIDNAGSGSLLYVYIG